MNRGLIALALISLLALLMVGCKATAPGAPAGTPTGTGSTETPATGAPAGNQAESSITGDIKDVDSLNTELNSSDLQNIDSLLNEVNW